MHPRVIFAIFKRNFFAYFLNPTGYVFICGFMLLTGLAAFWPHEFFNANLATLDQLNKYIPYILLLFIPAITMSLWADERRQGTDELLLTLPASDLDVVLGKYKAAVSIYTVALLFSLSHVRDLYAWGDPDGGLLFTTYIGYWLMGIAMLAVGMVASFLTANVTVGFVLGIAFNAPLVFAYNADVIVANTGLVQSIRDWSIPAKFADFTRGVLSLSSIAYFFAVMAIGLYLSLVLVGRRHWVTGGRGGSMLGHFVIRALSVIVIAAGLSMIFQSHDTRLDASSEGLSSLAPDSVKLLEDLESKNIEIEVFVSPEAQMPESYVQTRINLLNIVDEIHKSSGGRVRLQLHDDVEAHEPEATTARERYGIVPRDVRNYDRGALGNSSIIMGLAVTSGFDRRVIEFVGRGMPVEHELVRAIVSLSAEKKKTIGVVRTEVPLMSQFNPRSPDASREEQLIIDLQKQYEVLEVDLSRPLDRNYDVLLVVQPSTLGEQAMTNLASAIRSGQPTALFEDPMPYFPFKSGTAPPPPGTIDPPRPPQMDPMMMRMGMPPPQATPKGDINKLWDAIGAEIKAYKKKKPTGIREPGSEPNDNEVDVIDIVRQDFNPFPRVELDPEFVFVGPGGGTLNSDHAITSDLQFLLFPFAGSITPREKSKLTFTPLVTTGQTSGRVDTDDLFTMGPRGQMLSPDRVATADPNLVLAALITGKPADDAPKVNVVLVSDIDVASTVFFGIRDQGADDLVNFFFDVDNVAFVLNIIDVLADDKRFVDIRKHRRVHRSLSAFVKATEDIRKKTSEAIGKINEDYKAWVRQQENQINERIMEIRKEYQDREIDDQQAAIKVGTAQQQLMKRLEVGQTQLALERDRKREELDREREQTIRQMQSQFKRGVVFRAPLIPLVIGIVVFFWRRSRELQGASKARLR